MPFDLTSRLVIGLASSALFDLTESDKVFRKKGEAAYRDYQRKNQDKPLAQGVAFPFIRRLLELNKLDPDDPPVEVILLSHNDPDTGLRVMNSIEHHKLGMTRAVFLQGKSPHEYIPALDIELFLTANADDAADAMRHGYPAGHILAGKVQDDLKDMQLRIAFDFDGVLADDQAESVFQAGGLQAFQQQESSLADTPHEHGPLQPFLSRISHIQKLELAQKAIDESYEPILRVSIVTARNAPSHKRVINTMREWDIMVNDAFFMGGVDKHHVLKVLKPHIFFDDQQLHLEQVAAELPSVHIPFGVTNRVS